MKSIILTIFLCIFIYNTVALNSDHDYEEGEPIYVWINRIGPYHNPHETYDYYDLPFCKPDLPKDLEVKTGGISEVIEGHLLQNSGIKLLFKKDIEKEDLCQMNLNEIETESIQYAISNHYWYQLDIDGLPIWSKVGDLNLSQDAVDKLEEQGVTHEVLPDKTFIYTHRHFTLSYNQNNIIEVNLTSSVLTKVEPLVPITFTYSCKWVYTDVPFSQRFNRYLEYNFFESQIHWFSILNSFMIVIFLAGLVALIMMRTLNYDYARYKQDYSDNVERNKDDSGWKRIHGDVFRTPVHIQMYSILMGTGAQLCFSILISLMLILFGGHYVQHDDIITYFIIIYCACTLVNGYVSGSIYRKAFFPHPSPKWTFTMILAVSALPLLVSIGYLFLHILMSTYLHATTVPVQVFLYILAIWALIMIPLQTIGTIIGRNINGIPNYPCRTSSLPSPIPSTPFYTTPVFISFISGLLPFGAIFIEIFFIFTSLWSYKYYYVYGFLLFMVLVLLIITICVSIVGTYILLNVENYNWRWTSYFSGLSTGLYVFIYCVYFYLYKTEMSGYIQTLFFFTEALLLSSCISLVTAYISSSAAEVFVKKIFNNIKID
ncbi:hypothetical protein WA158_000281 [Blastocystis sp. Blastoise]